MAIAFARISYHSRSQGHSAVAGAAYRAGIRLYDERTGETYDFQNRSDVIYSELLLPEGVDERFSNREVLWNAVEAAETRKNSQIAKDIILALPRGLDLSHHIDLTKKFAQYHFVQHGIVADIAIHDHSDGNPHAHIYLTTRRLLGDRFDAHKARDLEPEVARGRVVNPQFWGYQWRDFQNRYFFEHNIDLVVDANHILSQRHEGRVRGKESHYLKEENQLRRQASIEIAIHDPASVLNLLGTNHAVFSERDIALLLHKNTETQAEYEVAFRRLKAHRDLILLGPGEDGRDRYTTRANYQREATLADHAQMLQLRYTHPVNPELTASAIQNFHLNPEQADALLHLSRGDIAAVLGRAGTGKTYLLRAARVAWEKSGYRLLGTAVSGIAAKGLEADSGIPCHTIYSLKMQLALGSLTLSPHDILIMDEAGMTDLHDMALLVDAVRDAGAKLVLVGDHAQLQPIGPGAPFRAIVEQIGFAELHRIQRQASLGDREATHYLSQGVIGKAMDYYAAQHRIHLIPSEDDDEDGDGSGSQTALHRLIADWAKEFTLDTLPARLILAHRKADVAALNQAARETMQLHGLLGSNTSVVETTHGKISLSVGDRLLFLRNHRSLRISNGEFATVKHIKDDRITVLLGKKQERELTFSTHEYRDFQYGYAATVHKSQGTTVDHCFVYVAGRAWDRFLSYVAMTRHRKTLNIYAEQSQFKDLDALKTTLSRSVLKDSVLDWPVSFAIRRGFDPESILGRFIDTVVKVKQRLHDAWLFVVNYEAFCIRQQYHQSRQSNVSQQQLAKKVALFVDLRNGLSLQARLIRQDLKPHEKFFEHPDYSIWYEHCLLRNQLADDIRSQYHLFKNALSLNRIHKSTLEKYALEHQRVLTVKNYLKHYQQENFKQRSRVARSMVTDFEAYFSPLYYFAKKADLSPVDVIDQIQRDAKVKAPARDLKVSQSIDEWEQLATIPSKTVERVIFAKAQLDKATQKMDQEIYQRNYEDAVKSLCNQEKVFSQVKTIAPTLAKHFEDRSQPKTIQINWLSDVFDTEFKALEKSNDKQHRQLAQLREWLRQDKGTSKERLIATQLESLAIKIIKHPSHQASLNKLAPQLTEKIIAFAKFKLKQRDIGRDL